jgi:hypothetical protein
MTVGANALVDRTLAFVIETIGKRSPTRDLRKADYIHLLGGRAMSGPT